VKQRDANNEGKNTAINSLVDPGFAVIDGKNTVIELTSNAIAPILGPKQ